MAGGGQAAGVLSLAGRRLAAVATRSFRCILVLLMALSFLVELILDWRSAARRLLVQAWRGRSTVGLLTWRQFSADLRRLLAVSWRLQRRRLLA